MIDGNVIDGNVIDGNVIDGNVNHSPTRALRRAPDHAHTSFVTHDVEEAMPSSDAGIFSIILQGYAACWPATMMLALGLAGSAIVALRCFLHDHDAREVVDYRQLKRPDRR